MDCECESGDPDVCFRSGAGTRQRPLPGCLILGAVRLIRERLADGALPELRRTQDIAAILEQPVIEKILTHLGLQARAPPRAPARGQARQAA